MKPDRNPHYGRKTKDGTIVDETCTCKHSRQKHGDVLGLVGGHAACELVGCGCRKFTWSGFVMVSEATP